MAKYGMVIDLDRCTGCQACTIACKSENNVPHGSPDEQQRKLEIYWHKVIAVSNNDYPTVNTTIIPMPCMHCEHPPCVTVCPAKATYRREDGIVMQNFRRCIGCKYCIVACPYGSRNFNYKEQEEKEYHRPDLPGDKYNKEFEYKTYIGPWPFPHRTHGVVEKCTFCFHRIDKGIKNNLKIGIDVVPACVEACPAEARVFGDIEDPESEVSKLLASRNYFRLKEDMGTEPKVIYLSR
jgi:molybdopterin-containing oxidoreductase family iron-sulfur binding subunit